MASASQSREGSPPTAPPDFGDTQIRSRPQRDGGIPLPRKLIRGSCRLRHLPLTPASVFPVVRVHGGVPGSSCALVFAPPHPPIAARDRHDNVARRRALLPWRDCDGISQAGCAWLRSLHRSWSWSCSEPKSTAAFALVQTFQWCCTRDKLVGPICFLKKKFSGSCFVSSRYWLSTT